MKILKYTNLRRQTIPMQRIDRQITTVNPPMATTTKTRTQHIKASIVTK